MKRAFLLKTFIAACSIVTAIDAVAQDYNAGIMGPRLIVTGTGISGNKRFTYSSNGTGSWGRALDSTWQNVPVDAASPDFTACGSINAITGNHWALIMRGNCEFGAKALAAQTAGAKGVIIVNNVAGAGPVGMGAGAVGNSVHIPVLMVSNEDGLAMKALLDASSSVTISLTKWGFGYAHDITIVPSSIAAGHNGAIPVNQLASGSPAAYRFYTGAFVANTGTQATTNVKLKQVTTFTPTGGSSSVVWSDSATAANLSVADSIIEVFSANSTTNNTSQTGRYEITYTVSSADADQNPADNSMTTIVDVTPQVFSKGHIEGPNQNPSASTYYSLTGNPNFLYGPLFYVNKGGYKAEAFKMAFATSDTSVHSLNGNTVSAYLFKWKDGSNGGANDGFIQSAELSLKSIAGKTLSFQDSVLKTITVNCADSNGLPGTVVTEDNTWYWCAVDVPATWFLGCDGNANYYNRTNAAQNWATNKVNDYWAPLYQQGLGTLQGTLTDTVKNIPFGAANSTVNIDSVQYSQINGTVPAVAFFTGQFPISVKPTQAQMEQVIVYPNPATNVINAKISLLNNGAVSYVRIIDAMGRNVYQVNKENFSQGVISISTLGFAAGNYHLLVGTGSSVISREFAVTSK